MSSNVKYIQGNIFTSGLQSLVNTVNCVGIMGAGIALEFKYRYPEMFRRYVEFCKAGRMQIGLLYIYDVPNSGRKVINFPTKKDWKHPSKIEYLTKGLAKFLETYKEKGITSAAFPLLGAQNGGLDPVEVKDIMIEYLSSIEIPIEIYEYSAHANDELISTFKDGLLYNKNEFKKTTCLSDSTIDKLREVLAERDLNSLIQLTKIKGIGEETIKACFQFAMKFKTGLVIEQEIFVKEPDNNLRHVTAENDHMNAQELSDETSNLENQVASRSQISNTVQIEANQNTKEATKANVNQKATKVKKSSASTSKSGKNKTLTIGEKQLMTDLPAEIIEKIESGSDEVTIEQIKAYVTGMNLKLKKFVTDKYLAAIKS